MRISNFSGARFWSDATLKFESLLTLTLRSTFSCWIPSTPLLSFENSAFFFRRHFLADFRFCINLERREKKVRI